MLAKSKHIYYLFILFIFLFRFDRIVTEMIHLELTLANFWKEILSCNTVRIADMGDQFQACVT